MRSFFLCVAVALLGCPAAPVVQSRAVVDPALVPEVAAGIDRDVAAVFAEQDLVGLSVAVVARGQLVYARGYGLADRESKISVETGTPFRLASVSKTITAVAAMQLVEQGKLDLEAPIQNYVPSFPAKPWPIDARELLGHLSGIRHYRGDEMLSARHYRDLVEPLAIFKDDALEAEPGTKFIYSSYGFNLLGAALETAGAVPFGKQVRERILLPAKMADTGIEDGMERLSFARGYSLGHRGIHPAPPFDPSNKIPSGGFVSTASDLARFAMALMDGRLVKPETRERMWTAQTTREGTSTHYGLGWGLGDWKGHKTVSHSGGQPGVTTELWLLPEEKCAVVLLANVGELKLSSLAHQLAARACVTLPPGSAE